MKTTRLRHQSFSGESPRVRAVAKASSVLACGVLFLGLAGCDDTAQAVKEEARQANAQADKKMQQAARDVKANMNSAAAEVKQGAKRTAAELERTVDVVDKKVANEIRGNDPKTDSQ